jgi:hypothetical protein
MTKSNMIKDVLESVRNNPSIGRWIGVAFERREERKG